MKVVSITWAHNEEDIIETFVRHTATVVDEMIIVPHECTDATLSILQKLQNENFPVTIHYDNQPYYLRPASITALLHSVSVDPEVQWILPLDADEFLCSETALHPRTELENSDPHTLYTLPWKTYVPTAEDNPLETDIRKRIQQRRSVEPIQFSKVLVPSSIPRTTDCSLGKGSHSMVSNGNPIDATTHPTLYIAHFPVRSDAQLRKKVHRICNQRMKDPTYISGQSFHLFELLQRTERSEPITLQELERIALYYAARMDIPHVERVYDPVRILVKHCKNADNPLQLEA